MPVMYGANPEQLTGLGTTLTNQIEVIRGVIRTVDSALGSTLWSGPAHDRFVQEWEGSFTAALNNLNEAFAAAGNDCKNRSGELARLMGAA